MPSEEDQKKDTNDASAVSGASEPVTQESSAPQGFAGTVVKATYEELEQQAEEYKSGWQRAVADYKNLQKETTERRAEWAQLSERMILDEFIPVYDNFKKAFRANGGNFTNSEQDTANSKQWENWKQGIGFIMKQFGDILKAHKVEEIKTVGEKFNPMFHESVGEEAVPGQEPHTIIREVEGGYLMGARVIKPAKVIVTK